MENCERKIMNENTLDPKKELPLFGWELIKCEREWHHCEYCGMKIKYRFFIDHKESETYLAVGSECVKKLTSDQALLSGVRKAKVILDDTSKSYAKFDKTFRRNLKGNFCSRKHGVAIFRDKFNGAWKIFHTKTKRSRGIGFNSPERAIIYLWKEYEVTPAKVVLVDPVEF